MSKKIHTQVGKRIVELSNLDKVLYPDAQVVKAEVINYYLQMAPFILTHLKGRPLSLVRYPDGIYGEQFFQKNRPDWAPDWVDYIRLGGERKKEYVVANEEAVLVWLANLACLEVHQMHATSVNPDQPDYIVYDLDPPETYDFEVLKEIAFSLKKHLESYGYHPFVKTTGGKGLHIVTPIAQEFSYDDAFKAAKKIADPFVRKISETTLHIKKEARKGRVLVDIYRNRPQQTIISAYSLRGKAKAPVSLPITWEELESVPAPDFFTIENAKEREEDAWETLRAWAVALHTHRKTSEPVELKVNTKRKSPDQLKDYESKRDFTKTPEPDIVPDDGAGNRFVVQRHHASHLHYDLRLEKDGVLLSWAIPRGLPPIPGIKRLAIQTEDHPLKYLSFEGEIPKGEYGGGMMWVFQSGRYEITKEKKQGFYFRLTSKTQTAEYRMHVMKENEWLLERVDNPKINYLAGFTQPMLAEAAKTVPKGRLPGSMIYEIKWDGIRALFVKNEADLKIYSRNGNDITEKFPELSDPENFRVENGVFDTEIVCLDESGKANFKKVIKRLMSKSSSVSIQQQTNPAVAYFFDCIYLDGKALIKDPMLRRRAWMEDSIQKNFSFRISPVEEDGEALFEAAMKHGIEGVMAKEKESKYYPGKRSDSWIKVKSKSTKDCYIIGFTKTKSEREKYFGALQLAEKVGEKLEYRGRVGTGFDQDLLRDLRKKMDQLIEEKPAEIGEAHDEKNTVWIRPELVCEIEYSMLTDNQTFRDPVFKKLIPEKI